VRIEDFDYRLPPGRIAQSPVEPRDSARLMVLDRAAASIDDRHFRDLADILSPGDLLVANDTRVLPARLRGQKDTGGSVEALLLRPPDSPWPSVWRALVRGRVRLGTRLTFRAAGGAELSARVSALHEDGTRDLAFDNDPWPMLDGLGEIPLPPYIHEPLADGDRYQTVFARVAGSVAAPTAGLHFTPELIARLNGRGIRLTFVTLHVGADTFRPIAAAEVERHVMHREWALVPGAVARAIHDTRRDGGRVVAVGTTAVRALETAACAAALAPAHDPGHCDGTAGWPGWAGWTDLFIRPGHRFLATDAMITNFHLPRTTLLVLVAAFAGKDLLDLAYAAAIAGDYRFYSFGDAMIVL
jgi:S-adenosylmethionine:tRNA ribosyltransferase-isomerase